MIRITNQNTDLMSFSSCMMDMSGICFLTYHNHLVLLDFFPERSAHAAENVNQSLFEKLES